MLRPAAGILLCLLGGVWFLQGVDVLGGSGMSGEVLWAWIGGAAFMLGLATLAWPTRTRRLRNRDDRT